MVRWLPPASDSSHSDRPHSLCSARRKSVDQLGGAIETPCVCFGPKNASKLESTSTRIESLSTVGASIGAALAISMHENAFAAAAPANAAVALRKSRRGRLSVIGCLRLFFRRAYEQSRIASMHPEPITITRYR